MLAGCGRSGADPRTDPPLVRIATAGRRRVMPPKIKPPSAISSFRLT